ncbi:hypothetical protein [Dactylosporangium salmoneum]|uniref:Bacterial transcriptional activator domain-containing protein n=1 Tax=Dactylosporangium salmoneum TaxID=53361 RepID=A0ABN3G1C2_9ACTN
MNGKGRRAIRAGAAAVVLLVVLAALPAVLVYVQSAVAWDWRALLAQPMSALGVAAAAIGVGWLVWAALVWQIMADGVAALRGRRRTVPLPVPVHTAVTAVVGAILLALQAARGSVPASASVGLSGTAAADVDGGQPPSGTGAPAAASRIEAGLDLPGGWLSLPIAAAVGAAVALVWAQTRRRYAPRPPSGWHRHDSDLPAPSRPIRQLLQTIRTATDDAVLGDDLVSTGGPAAGTAAPGAAADVDVPRALLDLLPAGELRLTGPGGHQAARGILVALTALGSPPRITLTTDFQTAVLGLPHSPAQPGPALAPPAGEDARFDDTTVVFTTGAGLDDAATPSVVSTEGRDAAPPGPARLVIRVAALPGGSVCWHVNADGTVRALTGPRPPVGRLAVLDRPTTAGLLTFLGFLPAPGLPGPTHSSNGGAVAAPAQTGLGGWPDAPPDTVGASRRLLVRVFGEVVVLRPHPDGSASPVPVRRSAGRQILVLLAVHRDGLTDDELKEALWPDVPGSAAHRRFLTTMSELRRALHQAAGRPVLHHDPATEALTGVASRRHRLDPAAVQVDLWRLQGLLDTAATTTDQAYRQLLLAAATDVAHGELAAGWTYEWLLADRERIVRHLLDVHTYLADLEPDDHTAVRLLQQALQLAPTNEHLHRRVLQRHAAAGDHDGLRRAAATLTEHLTAHNLQPEPDTVAVLTTLLAGTTAPADPTPGTQRDPAMPEGTPG